MSPADNRPDDDPFADTRMTFGEHLEDLRRHLWRAVLGFLVALLFSFAIGSYVLQFIKAPVQRQLEEFYAERARDVLRDRETDAKLRDVNRPQFVRLSFLPSQLKAAQTGTPETPPIPPEDKPAAYADLMARAQFLVASATDALGRQNWDELSRNAGELGRLAARLPGAEKAPDAARPGLAERAERLGRESEALAAEAGRQRTEASAAALARVQEALGDAGLVTLFVRVDDPLGFFAQFQGALSQAYRRPDLVALTVTEAFLAYVKVCMLCALVIASPWIFWQLWQFVAAGLYSHEKRFVNVYLPAGLVLFLAGAAICEFIVIPKAIQALLWFNRWLQFEPQLRFGDWLNFAILMPVIFGASFQFPLLMMFLDRVGIVTAATFRRKWKYVCFGIFVFAAIADPAPDPFSMLCLALPMFGLYLLGIYLCRFNPTPAKDDVDTPDPQDELVGV